MRRETQNILLVLLGGALLKISFTGSYLRYVKPSHQWLLIAGGAIMVALAVVSIARDLFATHAETPDHAPGSGAPDAARTADPAVPVTDSAAPAGDSAGSSPARTMPGADPATESAVRTADSADPAVRTAEPAVHAAAGHSHGSTIGAWLLLLPVLAVFVVAPPPLGANSVQNSASTNRSAAVEDGSAVFPPLPAGDVIALPLSDFSARAAWDKGNSLNDRQIRLTGFVVHDDGDTHVARLAIGCCAADAFPIKIKLADAPDLAALPNDTWVEVVAILQPGSASRENDFVPTARVIDVREIPQPDNPYEQ